MDTKQPAGDPPDGTASLATVSKLSEPPSNSVEKEGGKDSSMSQTFEPTYCPATKRLPECVRAEKRRVRAIVEYLHKDAMHLCSCCAQHPGGAGCSRAMTHSTQMVKVLISKCTDIPEPQVSPHHPEVLALCNMSVEQITEKLWCNAHYKLIDHYYQLLNLGQLKGGPQTTLSDRAKCLPMPTVQSVPAPMLANYLRQLFSIGDVHGDGMLPATEVRDLLARSGFQLPQHVITRLVDEAARSDDSRIEYEEFIPALLALAKEPPDSFNEGGKFDDPLQVQQWARARMSDMQIRAKVKEIWKDEWRDRDLEEVDKELRKQPSGSMLKVVPGRGTGEGVGEASKRRS